MLCSSVRQLGDVRGAQLPRAHVHRGARRLQQPQRVAGPEPQHPVHPSGRQLLLNPAPSCTNPAPLLSSCTINKVRLKEEKSFFIKHFLSVCVLFCVVCQLVQLANMLNKEESVCTRLDHSRCVFGD